MIAAMLLVLAGQNGPCAAMPMRAGTSWTYRAQVSWTVTGSAQTRDTTLTWRTRILATLTRDSSIVATVENWPASLAWWEPGEAADTTLLVCLNDQLYHLARTPTGRTSSTAAADSGAQQLTSHELILPHPIHQGAKYGQDPPDRTDTYYGWFVEAAVAMPTRLVRLGARPGDSLYTITYRTMPDHQTMDFAPGLGIVRYVYEHHGTVASASATLVSARLAH